MEIPSVEEMMEVLDTPYAMVPPTEEDDGEEIETNGLLLIEILKGVTRIEAKLDADEKEDIMEDFKTAPGYTSNSSPTFDAILMDNVTQS